MHTMESTRVSTDRPIPSSTSRGYDDGQRSVAEPRATRQKISLIKEFVPVVRTLTRVDLKHAFSVKCGIRMRRRRQSCSSVHKRVPNTRVCDRFG